jgi:hypothetical protein
VVNKQITNKQITNKQMANRQMVNRQMANRQMVIQRQIVNQQQMVNRQQKTTSLQRHVSIVQLDGTTMKKVKQRVFHAFQVTTRTKQGKQNANPVELTSIVKMPVPRHVVVVLRDGRLILPVPNVPCVVLALLVMVVNNVSMNSIVVELTHPKSV